jgi:hypothetical protein
MGPDGRSRNVSKVITEYRNQRLEAALSETAN